MTLEQWKVLEKREVRIDDGHQLVLVCERKGRKREAVVSGVTWLKTAVGDSVELTPL